MYKYVTTEEISKEVSITEDEETLHVIMSKEGSVVNNKF